MKSAKWMCTTTIALLAVLAIPVGVAAQGNQDHNHHKDRHYKLLDLGTFGGPQSWVFGAFEAPAATVNNVGTVVGGADTSASNPVYPNFNPFMGLGFADPFVSHAFKWNEDGLTDLGVLPGGYNSFAQWISETGVIVGASENGPIDPITGWPEIHAVVWQDGQQKDLGTFGGYESTAFAVNNHGQVAGVATNTANSGHAFLWSQEEGLQDLGTLGASLSLANLINDRGQISGVSGLCDTCNQDVFFWENGNMQHIPDFGGPISFPDAINNRGQVVGQSDLPGGAYAHPFLWDKKHGLQDLGVLPGGLSASAHWINEAGEIVGISGIQNDQSGHAVLWKHGITDLGTVDGDLCSVAESINEKGQIVGGTFDCNTVAFLHAFLWEKGGPMVDLNDLVAPGSGLTLTMASSINDRDEIAGQGVTSSGDNHAFLLIPCDEKHRDDEGCHEGNSATEVPLPRPTLREPARPVPSRTLPKWSSRYRRFSSTGSDRVAYDLPESAAPPKLFGYCVVNERNDTLTGECSGTDNFHCIDRYDKRQCPTGKKAIAPTNFSCQIRQVETVDAARICIASVCGGRCGFGCGPGCACGKDGMCHRKAGGSLEELLWDPQPESAFTNP